MKLLHGVGCVVLGVTLCLAAGQATGGGQGKDVKAKEISKDLIEGKVKTVDLDKSRFTIILSSGKDRLFSVDKSTKFLGPKGGKGAGLKDDRMAKGLAVKVLPAADGKTAKEVHLAYRKKTETKDKK